MSLVSSVNQVDGLTPYSKGGRIDPYAIFQLNFQALGGEKNVKNETSFRYKGEMTLDGNTLQIQEATKRPMQRLRIISSEFRVIYRNGDDGKHTWSFSNGKLNKYDDSQSPEREVRKLWEEYAYTDPKNRVFNATASRKTTIGGVSCYEVSIRNTKTDEVVTQYYDAQTFLLKREVKASSFENIQTDFADYKSVGNTKMAFRKDILSLNDGSKQSIQWHKIEKGVFISDSIFQAPEEKQTPSDLSSFTGTGVKVDTFA